MGDTIRTSDGKIVGIVPTMDQSEIDRIKRETEASNKVREKFDAAEAKKRERARKAMQDEGERRAAMVEGLRRFAKRVKREGDEKLAEKLTSYADAADKALTEYERHGKKLKSKRPDPLGDAAAAAAAELRKILPACFPSDKDALQFAQRLPLVDALVEAGRMADDYAKTARARTKAGRRFWDEVEAGGKLAVGAADGDSNVRALAAAGML